MAAVAVLCCLLAATGWSNADSPQTGTETGFGDYRKVLVEPVEVGFHPRWRPRRTGSRLPLADRERERIRDEIAAAFDRTFGDEVASGRLERVSEPGPGVLRLRPRLVDVTVNVIDDRPAFPAHTLIGDGDRFDLEVGLFDAPTDRHLATIEASRRLRGFDGIYRLADRLTMVAEAELVFRYLGEELREWLEEKQ